jgi:outer membrane protein OmpA-like peptidoglycan-associated protein
MVMVCLMHVIKNWLHQHIASRLMQMVLVNAHVRKVAVQVHKGDTACANALGALPSITFTGNAARLSTDAQGLLASVAARLRNSPECRIVVTSYALLQKRTTK